MVNWVSSCLLSSLSFDFKSRRHIITHLGVPMTFELPSPPFQIEYRAVFWALLARIGQQDLSPPPKKTVNIQYENKTDTQNYIVLGHTKHLVHEYRGCNYCNTLQHAATHCNMLQHTHRCTKHRVYEYRVSDQKKISRDSSILNLPWVSSFFLKIV